MSEKPTLLVIVCSTRPTRIGKAIADWFVSQAQADGRFEVQVADLKDLALPMMDEPKHPRMHEYEHEHTKAWSRTIRSADAVVWVTPEYNYAMVAPMKNAVDYLAVEWSALPTGFVSYGGVSGGIRAVEMAKQPLRAVGSVTTAATVAIPFAMKHVSDGAFTAPEEVRSSVAPLLAELETWHGVLRELRAQRLSVLAD